MSLENRIIKFCLNRDFFEDNKKRISIKDSLMIPNDDDDLINHI